MFIMWKYCSGALGMYIVRVQCVDVSDGCIIHVYCAGIMRLSSVRVYCSGALRVYCYGLRVMFIVRTCYSNVLFMCIVCV